MKLKIADLGKKVKLSIILIFFLVVVGIVVHLFKVFYGTDTGKTRIYVKELGDISSITENKNILVIKKYDLNNDEKEDYIILLGEPRYEEKDTSKVKILKSLSSKIEMYNNVSVLYVDGSTFETEKKYCIYNSKKTYGCNITFDKFEHNEKKYITLYDDTGNISLLYLKNGKLHNVITNTFGEKDFVGYTIEGEIKDEEGIKLKVNLDNYGKDYLQERKDTYTLDYKDTAVNEDNYRLTYMANKFSDFKFEESEDKSKSYLICTQYLLYSNKELLKENEGFVNTKFEINNENKLQFVDVEVTK